MAEDLFLSESMSLNFRGKISPSSRKCFQFTDAHQYLKLRFEVVGVQTKSYIFSSFEKF